MCLYSFGSWSSCQQQCCLIYLLPQDGRVCISQHSCHCHSQSVFWGWVIHCLSIVDRILTASSIFIGTAWLTVSSLASTLIIASVIVGLTVSIGATWLTVASLALIVTDGLTVSYVTKGLTCIIFRDRSFSFHLDCFTDNNSDSSFHDKWIDSIF